MKWIRTWWNNRKAAIKRSEILGSTSSGDLSEGERQSLFHDRRKGR